MITGLQKSVIKQLKLHVKDLERMVLTGIPDDPRDQCLATMCIRLVVCMIPKKDIEEVQ